MKRTTTEMIAREGWPFIAIAAVLLLLGALTHPILFWFFLALFIFVVSFFRNPKRVTPINPNAVISPADGKILEIGSSKYPAYFLGKEEGEMVRICIFMSPLNVHVNRMPVTGTVQAVHYNAGKYFKAYAEKASLENEQNAVLMKNEQNDPILFVQIAGFIARRIVCYAKATERWTVGSIYGLIRFGSRVDVYVPKSYLPQVKVGQMVRAGATILAEKK